MKKITLFLFALFVLVSINTRAQWSLNPLVNTVVDSAGSPNAFVSVSDGLGGVIIAWEDYRPGSSDIYVQRINYAGVVLWEDTGVVICTAIFSQFTLAIVSDGLGGAIITWEDQRDGTGPPDVYAQRVNADGMAQWTSDGVAICTAANGQYAPNIVSDGSGGAIISWQDARTTASRLYVSRVTNAGGVPWGADGVPVTSSVSYQIDHSIVSDGSGGAVIAWADLRNGNYDIYAQKVNTSGAMPWSADGVAICTQAIQQRFTTLVADGSAGAVISWNDDRGDLYAQRINAAGTVKWATDGITVSAANSGQNNPKFVSADSASVIITWEDLRTNIAYDIYAQRIDTSGNIRWTSDGVAICTATNSQIEPLIVSDSSGGAIITWKDGRSNTGDMDLYAQRINDAGTVQWTSNGVAISTIDPDYLDTPKASIVPDGAGGAIITWLNIRNVNDWSYDIYAQNICGMGIPGELGCNPYLPIELLSFTSRCVSALTENDIPKIVLNWSTATESNNDFFTLERSDDAFTWQAIGKLDGAGNSERILNYAFVDSFSNSSKETSSIKYYRLKQTDYNGDSKIFDLISCLCASNKIMKFEVYPIPASESLSIDFKNFHHQNLTIQIIDLFGRIIKKEEITDFNNNIYTLDISKFNSGRYFLKVNDLTKSQNVIFIKQ